MATTPVPNEDYTGASAFEEPKSWAVSWEWQSSFTTPRPTVVSRPVEVSGTPASEPDSPATADDTPLFDPFPEPAGWALQWDGAGLTRRCLRD